VRPCVGLTPRQGAKPRTAESRSLPPPSLKSLDKSEFVLAKTKVIKYLIDIFLGQRAPAQGIGCG
jgi:hypothetical protein